MSSFQSKKNINIITVVFSAYFVFAFVYLAALSSVKLYLGQSVTLADHYGYTSLLTNKKVESQLGDEGVVGLSAYTVLINIFSCETQLAYNSESIFGFNSNFWPVLNNENQRIRAPPFSV